MRLTPHTPTRLLAAGLLVVAIGCGDNTTPSVDTNNAGTTGTNNATTSSNSGTSTNNSSTTGTNNATTSTNSSTTGTNNATTSTNSGTTGTNNDPVAACEAICDRVFACEELAAQCPADALDNARVQCSAACETPDTRAQILAAADLSCAAVTPLILDGFGLAEVCQGQDLCATTTCDPGAACNPDTGQCVALSCDDDRPCPPGALCDDATGTCAPDRCVDVLCGPDTACDPSTGDCVAADLCADAACDPGFTCDPDTGDCVEDDDPRARCQAVCDAAVDCITGAEVCPDARIDALAEGCAALCDDADGRDALLEVEDADCDATLSAILADTTLEQFCDPCADVTCDPGFTCDGGECVALDLCADVTCDPDERCNPVNGECVPLDRCADVTCDPGERCEPSTGQCVAVDLCADVTCDPGQRCNPVNGQCVQIDRCADVVCDADERCNPVNGQCVPLDRCADVTCDPGFACDPTNGQCVPVDRCADVTCDPGFACDPNNGQCVPVDLCATVRCQAGFICDPDTGDCVPIDRCEDVTCDPGQRCDPDDGRCVPIDRCADVVCDPGFACDPNNGRCIAVDRCADVVCDPGFACNPANGQCVPLDLCADVTCDPGFACDPDTGDCVAVDRCADVVCDPGAACDPTDGQCVPLPCTANADCADGLVCNLPTGQCVTPDCSPDQLEPNDRADTAVALLGIDQTLSGLNICEGDSDWFVFDLAANRNALIDVLFANIDGDLDAEVFVAGSNTPLVTGTTASDNERLPILPAPQARTLFIRVFGFSGAANTYSLALDLNVPGQLCRFNSQCPDGEVCADSVCQAPPPCNQDSDCGGTGFCEVDTGICRECVSDDQCGIFGGICQDFACIDCRQDSDCFGGDRCTPDNVCVACIEDADCGDGRACDPDTNTCTLAGCSDALEPNDTQLTGTTVPSLNITLSDLQICTSTDDDWFTLNVPANTPVRIDVRFIDADGDIDARLTDAGGAVIDSGISTTDDETLYAPGSPQARTLHLRVYGFNDDLNTYDLTLATVECAGDSDCDGGQTCDLDANTCGLDCPGDLFEPNNTAQTAAPLPFIFGATNLCPDDIDWFTFDTDQASEITVTVEHDAPDGVNLTLYDDDRQVASAINAPVTTVTYTSDTASTFVVRVLGLTRDATINYTLNVSIEAISPPCTSNDDCLPGFACDLATGQCIDAPDCEPDAFEPNDAFSAPAPLDNDDSTYEANLCGGDDEDWFLVTIPNNQAVTVLVEFTDAVSDIDIQARDLNDTFSFAAGVSTSDNEQIVVDFTETDAFLLRVFSFDGNPSPYTLTLSYSGFCADDDACESDELCVQGACQTFVCEADDYEPNPALSPTPYEPGPFGTPGPYTVCAGDFDWWRFDLDANQGLDIEMTYRASLGVANGRLVASNGTTTLDPGTPSPGAETFSLAPAPAPRSVFFVVNGANAASQTRYDFSVTLTRSCFDAGECAFNETCDADLGACVTALCDDDLDCPDDKVCDLGEGACTYSCRTDDLDPNDTRAEATPIDPNTSLTDLALCRSIDPSDWFAVTVEDGARIRAEISFEHDASDIELELTDANGARIDSSTSISDSEQVESPFLAAGTYFIRVYAFNNGGNRYDLTVETFSTCDPDSNEPNGTAAQASDLDGFADTTQLSICPGDVDLFAFTASAGEGVLVTARFTHAIGDLTMSLLDANLQPLVIADTLTNNEQIFYSVPQAGTFYIRVEGATPDAANVYDIELAVQ